MTKTTVAIDTCRYALEDSPQLFDDATQWAEFADDVNRRGDAHASEQACIAEKANPGAWCCCLCLCCICGPCIFAWRMNKVGKEVIDTLAAEQEIYEHSLNKCVEQWSEKACSRDGAPLSITMSYEDRESKKEGHTRRYYSITFATA